MLAGLFALVCAAPLARADVKWDSKGWVKLGMREVNGKADHDTIAVGANDGKFAKLTLVVEGSDLELTGLDIIFGNGEKHSPNVRHLFKEGSRTRVLDLPGNTRVIQKIELRYKNTAGGGNARVEVWGWNPDAAGVGQGRPSAASFDSKGWTKLGERTVSGRVDHDRITVPRVKGKFEKLTIVVLDSDLELLDFAVKFGKGPEWNPNVRHVFQEGQRSRELDFPGGDRVIKYIDLKYANIKGGGKARIQVWAK